VEAGAEIGPLTALTRDVIVSAGTVLRASTVLPSTYIGPGLTLDRCIAQAGRLYHCALDVATRVSPRDAALLPLQGRAAQGSSAFGRAAAALLGLAALPALGAMAAWCWLRGGAMPWRRLLVLCPAHNGDRSKPRLVDLTVPQNPERVRDRFWAGLAGLLDVARGERTWFGARPRTIGQWYALPRLWQQALAQLSVGLVHAPAWADDSRHRAEAQALADVYGARTGLTRRVLRGELSLG
jgi:hypothetical protein